MRVLTFVISTFGAFGAQAQALIKDIGRRTNLFVPPPLSHETSWATSSITTFLRSALTFQVRKLVAVILCTTKLTAGLSAGLSALGW